MIFFFFFVYRLEMSSRFGLLVDVFLNPSAIAFGNETLSSPKRDKRVSHCI